MKKILKFKYLRPWLKIARKAKRFVLWIPFLSLAVGALISASIYFYLKQKEIETQKVNSYQRAKETINQLDLQISNSLLRIQTYEDSVNPLGGRLGTNKDYISQALEYTIFHRLTVLKDINPHNLPNKKSGLKLLSRIDRKNSGLPKSNNRFVQSQTLIGIVEEIKKSSSYQRIFLYENMGQPRMTVVMRSKAQKDIFYIFSAPLISLFEKIDLDGDESIMVREANQNMGWVVIDHEPQNEIQGVSFLQIPVPTLKTLYHFNFEQGLPQSGFPLSFQFNYTKEDTEFFSAANIGGLLSAFITLIISYLFYVLITLNQTAQRMIINKTIDLEKTAHDLQVALNGKTKFLGKISHEIRTPLNLILGMVDLCEENDTDKKLSNYLRSMKSSGEHLLSMIDDLLDLAKAESSDLNFHGRKIHTVQFLGDVSKLCSNDCETKGIKFYTHFSHQLPNVIVCDPNRLRQVLLNLLRNACKYTYQGHINFNVSLRGPVENNMARFRFEIQDSGVGIPKDKLTKVFDAFFQVESASAFSEGGVGLGLSIVKDIVKKMNGHIEVTSTLNTGSTFQVDLDLEVFEASPWINSYKSETPQTKNLIFLSTDRRLQKTMEPLSHHPQITLEIPQPKDFQHVLKNPIDNRNTFLLIDTQSTHFNLEEIAQTWNSKCIILIGKSPAPISSIASSVLVVQAQLPFLPNELLGNIGLSSRTRQRAALKAAEQKSVESIQKTEASSKLQDPLELIVADDDLGNIELYKAYFAKTAWKVHYAVNGLEAWEIYQKEKSDLLILDVRMPIMDGFSVIQKVREKEKKAGSQHVPIIVVTADLLDYTTEKSKQFDDVTLLTKPLKKTLLFEQIHKSF